MFTNHVDNVQRKQQIDRFIYRALKIRDKIGTGGELQQSIQEVMDEEVVEYEQGIDEVRKQDFAGFNKHFETTWKSRIDNWTFSRIQEFIAAINGAQSFTEEELEKYYNFIITTVREIKVLPANQASELVQFIDDVYLYIQKCKQMTQTPSAIESDRDYQHLHEVLSQDKNQWMTNAFGLPALDIVSHHYAPSDYATVITALRENNLESEQLQDCQFNLATAAFVYDFIELYEANRLPLPLLYQKPEGGLTKSELALSKGLKKLIEDYKENPAASPNEFLTALDKLCKAHQPKINFKKRPEAELLFHSIAALQAKSLRPPIYSVRQLLIAQEKQEAIACFKKEMKRLENRGFFLHGPTENPDIKAKYHTYANLIHAVYHSSHDTPLSAILEQDSAVMRKHVQMRNEKTGEWTERCNLPGKPYARIQDVLAYHRGRKHATSQKKLERLRSRLINPDAALDRYVYKQQLALLLKASRGRSNKILETKDKIFDIRLSRHFPKEHRFLEIHKNQAISGKGSTKFYPEITKRWKLGNNRLLGGTDIAGQYGAKAVRAFPYKENVTSNSQNTEEVNSSVKSANAYAEAYAEAEYRMQKKELTEEVDIAKRIPAAKMKSMSHNKDMHVSMSVRGMAPGKSLSAIIKEQNHLQVRIHNLINGKPCQFITQLPDKQSIQTLAKQDIFLLQINDENNHIEYIVADGNEKIAIDTGMEWHETIEALHDAVTVCDPPTIITNPGLIETIQWAVADNDHTYYPVAQSELGDYRKDDVDERIRQCQDKLLTQVQRDLILVAVSRSLQEWLHDVDLVHLDMKSANVIVDLTDRNDPKARVIDYDLTAEIDEYINARGTPDYVPVEFVIMQATGFALGLRHPMVPAKLEMDMSPLAQLVGLMLFAALPEKVKVTKHGVPDLTTGLAGSVHGVKVKGQKVEREDDVDKRNLAVDEHFQRLITNSRFVIPGAAEEKPESLLLSDEGVKAEGIANTQLARLAQERMPLLKVVKQVLVSKESERPSLDEFINHCEMARIKDQVNDQVNKSQYGPEIKDAIEAATVAAYRIANDARKELRELHRAEDKLDSSPIKRIIQESFAKLAQQVSGEVDETIKNAMMEEYFHTLGIPYLKAFYVKKNADGMDTTEADVLAKVDEVFNDYQKYQDYLKLNFIKNRDKIKITDRYEDFKNAAKITRINLNDMVLLNEKNRKTLLPYQQEIDEYEQYRIAQAEKAAQAEQGQAPAPLPALNNNEITACKGTIFEQVLDLPPMMKAVKAFAKKNGVVLNLEDTDAKNDMLLGLSAANSRFNLSKDMALGTKYEMRLICRAVNNLDTYLRQGISFASLPELLRYQQKRDVLDECRSRRDAAVPNSEKQKAYQDLYDAIEAKLTNHAVSVPEIIGKHWFDFTYFTSKMKRFHLFQNSGDLFDKICQLPNVDEAVRKMTAEGEAVSLQPTLFNTNGSQGND